MSDFIFTPVEVSPAEAIRGLLNQAYGAMVASREAKAAGRDDEASIQRRVSDELHSRVDALVKARDAAGIVGRGF